MNRLRSGAIITIPNAVEASATAAPEATRTVRVQASDWRAYRDRVAGAAPMADEGGGRAAGGRIGTAVEERTPAARPGSDQLRVSKEGAGKGAGAAESTRGARRPVARSTRPRRRTRKNREGPAARRRAPQRDDGQGAGPGRRREGQGNRAFRTPTPTAPAPWCRPVVVAQAPTPAPAPAATPPKAAEPVKAPEPRQSRRKPAEGAASRRRRPNPPRSSRRAAEPPKAAEPVPAPVPNLRPSRRRRSCPRPR